MEYLSKKSRITLAKIREILTEHPNGIDIENIANLSQVSKPTVINTLTYIKGIMYKDGYYILPKSQMTEGEQVTAKLHKARPPLVNAANIEESIPLTAAKSKSELSISQELALEKASQRKPNKQKLLPDTQKVIEDKEQETASDKYSYKSAKDDDDVIVLSKKNLLALLNSNRRNPYAANRIISHKIVTNKAVLLLERRPATATLTLDEAGIEELQKQLKIAKNKLKAIKKPA